MKEVIEKAFEKCEACTEELKPYKQGYICSECNMLYEVVDNTIACKWERLNNKD